MEHIAEVVQLSQTFKHLYGFIKDYVDNTQNPFCKSKVYGDVSHECIYIILRLFNYSGENTEIMCQGGMLIMEAR